MNINENSAASKSQKQQILDFLLEGGRLTQLVALNKFGCFRLASRISELRSEGFDIRTEKTTTTWSKKKIAEYYLAS